MIAGSLSGPTRASATHIGLCAHVDARCPQQRLHNGELAVGRSAVQRGHPTLRTAAVTTCFIRQL